ncbi:MAG: hypothetical protein ACREOI_16470, partial [bacterium]
RKKSFALLPLVAAALNLIYGCTSNPFGDDKISEEKRKISGVAQLADQSSAKGIMVWMAGFNISTLTDENGGFEINLPPKGSQGPAGGLSGIFNMYFFVANYLLDSAQVVVQNGAFLYSRGDVNKDGKLSAPRSLRRFLRISTAMLPPSVEKNFANRIGVSVTLEAIIDSATVVFPRSVGGFLGAVFFKRVGSDDLLIYEPVAGANTRDVVVIGKVSNSRLAVFTLQQLSLQPGQYEVIPYLLIRHEALPSGLLTSLGAVEDLSPAYLNLPLRREGGQFEVRQ